MPVTLVASITLANVFSTRCCQRLHQVAVGAGQQAGRHLDHRHLGAERGVDRAQFEADVAAADDEQRLRDRPAGRARRSSRAARGLSIDRPGNLRRDTSRWRARGSRLVTSCVPVAVTTDSEVGPVSVAAPLDVGDLAQLGDLAGAAGELLDDLVLVGAQLVEVDLRRAELDAPGARRASPRRAAWRRAAAPSTGCSRGRGTRRRGSSPRRRA